MPVLSRRQLLSSAAATAALGLVPRPARACGWSADPRVLEIFLKGGFSPWQSFWSDPAFADPEGTPDWPSITGGPVPIALSLPGLHNDELGAAASPLHPRLTLVDKGLRVAVMQHDLEPHEAAVPYAITGTRLGRPQLKGLAAAVNFTYGTHPLHAFVLDAGHASTAAWAAEAGELGSQYRPPVIRMGDPDLLSRLDRASAGVTRLDGVEAHLAREYRAEMVHPTTTPDPVRSRGFAAYEAAIRLMHDYSDDLLAILGATSLVDPYPPTQTYSDSLTRRAARVGAELLRSGGGYEIRYVCVVDAGVERSYDTHDGFGSSPVTKQAGNLWSLCSELAALDTEGLLDGVLVVLNTEFGRMQLVPGTDGTEHWPWGYVNVLMGAPYTRIQHRGGIDAGGYATGTTYAPQDLRAVLGHYLGVDPATNLVDPALLTQSLPALEADLLLGDPC